MNLLAPVTSIMQKNIITLQPNDTIKKAEDIFKTHKIHHIPIIENEILIGMLSKSDFLFFKRGFNQDRTEEKWDLFRLKSHQVSEIMTTKLAKLEPTDRINVAIEVFKENLFHALPVVEDHKIVGIITTYDIIKHLAEDKDTVKEYNL